MRIPKLETIYKAPVTLNTNAIGISRNEQFCYFFKIRATFEME